MNLDEIRKWAARLKANSLGITTPLNPYPGTPTPASGTADPFRYVAPQDSGSPAGPGSQPGGWGTMTQGQRDALGNIGWGLTGLGLLGPTKGLSLPISAIRAMDWAANKLGAPSFEVNPLGPYGFNVTTPEEAIEAQSIIDKEDPLSREDREMGSNWKANSPLTTAWHGIVGGPLAPTNLKAIKEAYAKALAETTPQVEPNPLDVEDQEMGQAMTEAAAQASVESQVGNPNQDPTADIGMGIDSMGGETSGAPGQDPGSQGATDTGAAGEGGESTAGGPDAGDSSADAGGEWAQGGVTHVEGPTRALFGEKEPETAIFIPAGMQKPGIQGNELEVIEELRRQLHLLSLDNMRYLHSGIRR